MFYFFNAKISSSTNFLSFLNYSIGFKGFLEPIGGNLFSLRFDGSGMGSGIFVYILFYFIFTYVAARAYDAAMACSNSSFSNFFLSRSSTSFDSK